MPKCEMTKNLVTQAISQLNSINESIAFVAGEMSKLAAQLPEYGIVMDFYGVGEVLGSQLIAEIGDIYRYQKKSSLVRFAGLWKTALGSSTAEKKSPNKALRT